ncbi:MAG: hypothetical protein AABZ70_03275 [candidate division NC10 bacterium]
MPEASVPGLLRPVGPCAIVIFGAAGDLTKRKLLPALYNLKVNGLLPQELAIVGVTRKEKSHEQFRAEQSQDMRDFATQAVDEALWGARTHALLSDRVSSPARSDASQVIAMASFTL